ERDPARVLEGLPRLEVRLLADDAGSFHHLFLAVAVADDPAPPEETGGGLTHVVDPDRVGEGEEAGVGGGALLPVGWTHGDADPFGGSAGHDLGSARNGVVLQSSRARIPHRD